MLSVFNEPVQKMWGLAFVTYSFLPQSSDSLCTDKLLDFPHEYQFLQPQVNNSFLTDCGACTGQQYTLHTD